MEYTFEQLMGMLREGYPIPFMIMNVSTICMSIFILGVIYDEIKYTLLGYKRKPIQYNQSKDDN